MQAFVVWVSTHDFMQVRPPAHLCLLTAGLASEAVFFSFFLLATAVPHSTDMMQEDEEELNMLQTANKSDRMCHLLAMTMRSSSSP